MNEMFLLDTNTFLTPYESYYAPDLVPSFWNALEKVLTRHEKVAVLDLVEDEILKGEDNLTQWFQELAAKQIIKIISHNDIEIISWYGKILQFLQENPLYTDRALRNWAQQNIADPWLIAAAKAYGYTIITFEVPAGTITANSPTSKPKIPTVGRHFGVMCHNLYYFMRQMGIKL